jgi:cutinase
MPAAIAPHVAAVTLFGKPSNGLLNLVDRSAPPVTIGKLYSTKTIELCARGDPVCGGGLRRAAHSAYKNNGVAEQAADVTARALSSSHLGPRPSSQVITCLLSGSPINPGGQCAWRQLQEEDV